MRPGFDQPTSLPAVDGRRVDDAGSEWYAVQVWAGREKSCAQHLHVRSYEAFLPCYAERRRWSDRVKQVERALFAGYVFCRMSPAAAGAIMAVPGVLRVVGDRSGPLPVRSDEIEAIRRIVESRRVTEPWPHLQVGERVRIEWGPLRGTEGVVLTLDNRHRLVVSISLLQRSVAVEIDPAWCMASHPIGEQRADRSCQRMNGCPVAF